MTRRLSPYQYRHHHTWRWRLGLLAAGILGLAGACSGGPQGEEDTHHSFQAPPAIVSSPGATAPPTAGTLMAVSSPADTLVAAHRQLQAQARRLVVPDDPVAVDLYTLDRTCDAYQIEPIQVPRPQSMEATVDLILAEQRIPDLRLSGYRTSFDPATKTVTIDLRIARDSRRVLRSLSFCEQKALLGSLRETLLNQPDWQLEAVIFTDRGNPLVP